MEREQNQELSNKILRYHKMSDRSFFSLSSIPEALLTGGLYVVGERIVVDSPLDEKAMYKFAESSIASLVSSPISEVVWSVILPEAQMKSHPYAIHDVTSGLLFALADSMLGYSSQSFLYKFLLQTGAEAVSENVIGTLGF